MQNHFLNFAAAALMVAAFAPYADAGLTIGATSRVLPTHDKLFADSEQMISGLVYSVELTNTGDAALAPGDENYTITLYQTTKAVNLVTVPLPEALAAGETKTMTVEWPSFSIQPLIDTDPAASSFWSNLAVRENVSSNTKNVMPWCDVYTYSVAYALVGETSGTEIDKPISFGYATEAKTLKYRLRATGAADLKVKAISLPDGYTVSPAAPFTVKGLADPDGNNGFQPLEITFNPTTPGVKAGVMTFDIEGADAKSYAVSGAMVGDGQLFEDFEQPEGASSDYVPEGWIFQDKWRVTWKNTSADDHYMADHSSAMDDEYTYAISPRVHFAEGEAVMFEAARKSYSSKLEVCYSPDRVNWTPVLFLTANGTEDGATKFSSNSNLDTYTAAIPQGDWYVGFRGMYVSLNNVFGGTLAPAAHDIYALSQTGPAKLVVNHAGTYAFTARNLSAAEAAGSYKVELIVDGAPVASCEASDWAKGETKTFSADFTPHAAGTAEICFRITAGDTKVESAKIAVTVSPETASSVITVGTANGTSSNVPLQTNYNNSASQAIYSQAMLEQYGETAGTKIVGVAYDAVSDKGKKIPATLTVWMQNTDATAINSSEPFELPTDAAAARDENFVLDLPASKAEKVELAAAQFAEPFVYTGGNLLVSVQSEASDWGNSSFDWDKDYTGVAIYRRNDNHDSFLTSSWSSSSGVPVMKLSIFNEAAVLSGTVTAAGAPVADTEVTLSSGDVLYTAVTDTEGRYSMEVFQPELPYTMTVDYAGAKYYTAAVDMSHGSVTNDVALEAFGNEREFKLSLTVGAPVECDFQGIPVKLRSSLYSIDYPEQETLLDADGRLSVALYGGDHTLTVAVPGMRAVTVGFSVNRDRELAVELAEDVRTPYGLKADLVHDIYTGSNSISLRWNTEEPVFTDGFESYAAFTVDPAPWTGIDGDLAAPAILNGTYPNQGQPNYGQIINPSAVDPAWDLDDYFTLRPRSGNQYAGFVVLADNSRRLDDWLISPEITLTDDNILRFYAKSADSTPAKFAVGIAEASAPTAADFTIINEGNVIVCPYDDWKEVEISLAGYAGRTVKIGLHCMSEQGSFISMVDDFFVGRAAASGARRVAARSAENPNEKFEIYLDGAKAGETESYAFTIENVAFGEHTVEVKAVYKAAESAAVSATLAVSADDYAKVDFAVSTNNGLLPDGTAINLNDADGNTVYALTAQAGYLSVASLPKGSYTLEAKAEFYDTFTSIADIDGDKTVAINLKESLTVPFNITAEAEVDGNAYNVTLRWNQDLGYTDSFEDYDDFATGTFGGWKTVDRNSQPSYPISLGSQTNIITFPGCSTPASPAAVPPMVFNPSATKPSMAADGAILAPDGEKSIAFFSVQQAVNDKWLISPAITVGQNYVWRFAAKAYDVYPESLKLYISETGNSVADFAAVDELQLSHGSWTTYEIDLADYAGKTVYFAIQYNSTDAMIAQIDKFEVVPVSGSAAMAVGHVQSYDVLLDGTQHGNTPEAVYVMEGVASGTHKVAIHANYASGRSDAGEYDLVLDGISGVDGIGAGADYVLAGRGTLTVGTAATAPVAVYTASGAQVAAIDVSGSHTFALDAGIYFVKIGTKAFKVVVK